MTSICRNVGLLTIICLWFCVHATASGGSRVAILELQPTALFPQRLPLAQVARLTIRNDAETLIQCDIVVTIGDGKIETVTGAKILPRQSVTDVLVPDISEAGAVTVELRSGDRVLARHEQAWQPQRKWKVYIVKSSHEDIGYEDYIFKKQRQIAEHIDMARRLSAPRAVTMPDGKETMRKSPYHYTLESILFQRNYIEERGETAWRSLIEQEIKPGHMSLMGAPSGVHSHWMDYEELARMSYPARRETKDRFGLDIETFMIVDNPSLSWSGMQALAEAGFKYVARWGQQWRTGGKNDYATTGLPSIFWWEAPDGHNRVLFSWRYHYAAGFWYGQTGSSRHRVELAAGHVSEVLQGIEAGQTLGPYPYDALVVPDYIDHDTPRFDMSVLPAWTAKFAYPEIKVADPTDYFRYMEQAFGARLPVLKGDLNNFSADYSSIDPVSQGWKRDASRLLPAAEGMAVLAGTADAGFALPLAEVERLYTRMFDYDEHSWPTKPRASDEQLFNAVWVKNHEARRTLEGAETMAGMASAALARNISAPGPGTVAVFNPLVHPRSDLVEAAVEQTNGGRGRAGAVVDLRTGKSIPCEPTRDGKIVFRAENVPAFGYALYQFRSDATATPPTELTADRHSISNRYYTVSFHPENGSVTSVVDKVTGRELIDASAPYFANQLVYVHKNEREAKEGYEYSPPRALRMEPRVGATQVAFDVWINDPKLGGDIRQTVTLYAGVKRVEFTNRLENISVMAAKTYEDRYRDNLYYAFPFAVPNGQIRVEYPGGVVRPFDDQLRWGSHDFLYANRWIDVSNSAGGVTLAAREAGTFSFGQIRYNEFSVDYRPERPWLFSYVWSNRMGGLLTLGAEDCDASFTYWMTSHDGDWDSGAAVQHGWQTASPLLAIAVEPTVGTDLMTRRWTEPAKTFLSIDASNVQMTVLKASGQPGRGWVARFVETDGRGAEFTFDVSALGVSQAALCDLVENDREPLAVVDGRVRISVRPFGFATVRLLAEKAPGAAPSVRATEVSDSTVRLAWDTPSTGGSAYNVYRSVDARAPATAYTLVGRTSGAGHSDTGLNIDTDYYYYVASVSAANREGPLYGPLKVRTTAENLSPPAPVREVGVVRRAHDTLILYWRKSPEPDVARYLVFRSEAPEVPTVGVQPHAVVEANAYFLQIFRDGALKPGTRYYYRVLPVDWAGRRQAEAIVADATTPENPS